MLRGALREVLGGGLLADPLKKPLFTKLREIVVFKTRVSFELIFENHEYAQECRTITSPDSASISNFIR